MAGVASAVGITAPAIYRHFDGKQDLLAAAIGDGLDFVLTALATVRAAPLPEFLHVAAGVALARRDLWTLLQRETRHLGADQRKQVDTQFAAVVRLFTGRVRHQQPDLAGPMAGLMTTAVLATLASPSVYRAPMPAASQQQVLAAAAGAVCSVCLPARPVRPAGPGAARAEPGDGHVPADRSAQVLATAVRLFAGRGYEAVSLDDIGAELGLAGPSLYYYFATKSDILVAALGRAADQLAVQRETGLPLDELVAAYADLAVAQRLLFSVYVSEAVSLPPEAGRRIRSGIRADVAAWSAALARERPQLTAEQRLVLVHAARAVVYDVVRLGHWHDRADLPAVLRSLVGAVLTAPIEGPDAP